MKSNDLGRKLALKSLGLTDLFKDMDVVEILDE